MTSLESLVRVILADRHFRFELISHWQFEKERVISKSELFAFDWRNILAEVLKISRHLRTAFANFAPFQTSFRSSNKKKKNKKKVKKKLEIL